MKKYLIPPSLSKAIAAFKKMPGIGEKTATRLVMFMFNQHGKVAQQVSETLSNAVSRLQKCKDCNMISEAELCYICADVTRIEKQKICIVEEINDLMLIENHGLHDGTYLIMDEPVTAPTEIDLRKLTEQLAKTVVAEVIIALAVSPEREATSWLLK